MAARNSAISDSNWRKQTGVRQLNQIIVDSGRRAGEWSAQHKRRGPATDGLKYNI